MPSIGFEAIHLGCFFIETGYCPHVGGRKAANEDSIFLTGQDAINVHVGNSRIYSWRRGRYNVNNIPQTFIMNKEGVVVSKYIGSGDWAEEKEIQSIKDLVRKLAE